MPVLFPKASYLIANYKEYVLMANIKFDVLYQRFGQITDKELYANNTTSPTLDEFLGAIAQHIRLKDYKSFWGGLDIQNGHTGDLAMYEVF